MNPTARFEGSDRAKHAFAVGSQLLAEAQYRLAELAGTGQLDADESMHLQWKLVEIYEHFYAGTLCAVRDSDIPDDRWDEADNTYSDGTEVITQIRIERREFSDDIWPYNQFLVGDGAPNEFPRGTISHLSPIYR